MAKAEVSKTASGRGAFVVVKKAHTQSDAKRQDRRNKLALRRYTAVRSVSGKSR